LSCSFYIMFYKRQINCIYYIIATHLRQWILWKSFTPMCFNILQSSTKTINNIIILEKMYCQVYYININIWENRLALVIIWYTFQCFAWFPFIWRVVINPGMRLSTSFGEIPGLQWALSCPKMYYDVLQGWYWLEYTYLKVQCYLNTAWCKTILNLYNYSFLSFRCICLAIFSWLLNRWTDANNKFTCLSGLAHVHTSTCWICNI